MNRTILIIAAIPLIAGCTARAPGKLMYEAIDKCEINGGVKEFNTWSASGALSVFCNNGAEFFLDGKVR